MDDEATRLQGRSGDRGWVLVRAPTGSAPEVEGVGLSAEAGMRLLATAVADVRGDGDFVEDHSDDELDELDLALEDGDWAAVARWWDEHGHVHDHWIGLFLVEAPVHG